MALLRGEKQQDTEIHCNSQTDVGCQSKAALTVFIWISMTLSSTLILLGCPSLDQSLDYQSKMNMLHHSPMEKKQEISERGCACLANLQLTRFEMYERTMAQMDY